MQKCVQIFGNEGRSEMRNYRSFAVKVEGKSGGGTSHIWQWRHSVSGEADLQIFCRQDWAKVRKRNCKSLEVQAEMKCGSGNSHLWKSWQSKFGKRNFRYLPLKAERKGRSITSHIWQSRRSGTSEAELHIFGSQGRTKVRTRNFRSLAVKTERKRNFISLAVKAERKFGSGTSCLWQSRQGRSVEAENQIFSLQDWAEVWKQNCRSLTVQSSWACGSRTKHLWQAHIVLIVTANVE